MSTWIRTAKWDSTFLIGSALIVPLVLLAVWGGAPAAVIGLGVTAIIGGPHLFSTFAATFLDTRFRREHPVFLPALLLTLPLAVVYLTIHHFQVLLSIFIFAASLHVLQQNAFIAEMYRARATRPEGTASRFIDHAVLMLSFYPIASYKLVNGTFLLGDVEILIPRFAKVPATYFAVSVLFGAAVLAFVVKLIAELRAGTVNRGKTTLIAVTATIAFFTPLAASGARLELAFQAVNAWHSFQYMALIALFQRIRADAGLVEGKTMRALTSAPLRYYGACLATTLVLFGAITMITRLDPFGLTANQYYYMGVLSCLLMHYALDGYLFIAAFGKEPESVPFAAPRLRENYAPAE